MGAFTPFMFTMAMGTSVLLLLFAVGLLVVSIVSNWCVFTKAGEPGWKIFIPVYGSYVSYRIAGVSLYYWISLLMSAALRLMHPAAQAAGYPQPEAHAVGLYLQRRLPALGAFHPYRRRRQGELAAPGHHGLAALGADVSKASRFLH